MKFKKHDSKVFGQNVKRELEKRNMSQIDLAKRTKLTAAGISQIIRGPRTRGATLVTACAIANALNLPLGQLVHKA